MKKFISFLICAALLTHLSACSRPEDNVPTAPTVAPSTQAPTEPPVVQSPMKETVLVDNDAAAFTVTEAKTSSHAGMQLYVRCVNKTDRALMFSWDMVSVCGYMYDPLWAVEVAAGKSANSIIDLDTYQLEKLGITSVDEVTFTLRIYDSEDWMEPPVVQQVYTIYPTGLSADTLILPAHPSRDTQVIIADDENLRFVIEQAQEETSTYTLQVYMENKTERNLMYSWDLVSVNGSMIDPLWAAPVAAGKRACSEISFSRSDLEKNAITDISDISFQLIVSDYDDWSAPNLLKQVYTYRPTP